MYTCLPHLLLNRMHSRSILAVGIVLFLNVGASRAQQHVTVHVQTNDPDATVFADSLRLGRARLGVFRVPASARMLRLIASGGNAWSVDPQVMPLKAAEGDTVHARLPFPYHYNIETLPFGVAAYLVTNGARKSLGKTPALFITRDAPTGVFVLERAGYRAAQITPGREIWNPYLVSMEPMDTDMADPIGRPVRPAHKHRWIDYSAAVLAIAGGALAVHYKFKADRLDDQYRKTGNPAERPRIRALDDRSAVSLGVMQAGLVVLAVRFVLK